MSYESGNELTLSSRIRDAPSKSYKFDGIFTENSEQKEVYDAVVSPAVKSALEGFNCTVFAYGQTGSGKTFTMEGGLEGGAAWAAEHAESGMIPRAVRDVFDHLQKNMDVEYSVRVSHMELFNEELIDLLGSPADEKPLRLFEHPKEGVTVHNLEQVPVTSADAIFKILRRSSVRRREAATKLNASSSRSHCIFTVTIQTKESTSDNGELIRIGRLHLIDLAGSENVVKAGTINSSDAKRETGVINQSLLVLGRVITALSENRPHVPYRESKLTRLMADAIGGKNKTAMIACITQAASSYDETQATLEYAAAARKIKNKPEVNAKITKKAVIKEYLHEIERLKMQVNAAREKNGVYLSPEEFQQMEEQLKAFKERAAKLETELSAKAKQLEDASSLLSTANEKLKDTTETLTMTQSDLEETRATLSETQGTLEQTQDALEENVEVIRHQSTTEKVLFRNATRILDTLDVREQEVEALHAKIDRKRHMEEENRAISASFREYVGGKVQDMTAQLERFRGMQSEQLATIRDTVHKFMEEKTADMDKLCEKLDSLQDMLQTSAGLRGAAISAHTEDTGRQLAALEDKAAHGRTAIDNALTKFTEEAERTVSKWRADLDTQRGEVTEWSVNTTAALQMLLDAQGEWSEEHVAELRGLKASLERNTAAALAWAEEHRNTVEKALSEHKARTEARQREMTRQVSDLVSNFVASQQKAMAENIAALQKENRQHVAALNAQHAKRINAVEKNLVPAVEKRAAKLQAELDAFQAQVDAQDDTRMSELQGEEKRAASFEKAVENFQSRAEELSEAADARLATALEEANDQLATASAATATMQEGARASHANWRDEATEFAMVSRASIEETQMAVEAKIKGLEQHTSVFFGDKLQSELSGVTDQFFHYFDSLREDTPTGSTPQKRVLHYPTELPRSRDDAEIIEDAGIVHVATQPVPALSAPHGRMSLPASPEEFADFAAPARGILSDSTPVHERRITASATSSKLEERKKQLTEREAKKAAVKAQRMQQQQQQPAQPQSVTQSSKKTMGGPQRTALAPVTNRSK